MDRSEREGRGNFSREINPKPIRADYHEGDKYGNTSSYVQEAYSAVLGISHQPKSTGILAGSMDRHKGVGVAGKSESIGVLGMSNKGVGVWCESNEYEAVHAESNSSKSSTIAAYNFNDSESSSALFAKKIGKGCSAIFDGNVNIVAGDLNVQKGILKINGQSVWELIYDLQSEVNNLKSQVINADNKAETAQQTADRAQQSANNANNAAKKALDQINS
ncbi:MAG: hypothetical protein IPM96_09915 [Ignavibacteria bacterium]|nr:hypothetical protein [Ignavibacteria bacterium]